MRLLWLGFLLVVATAGIVVGVVSGESVVLWPLAWSFWAPMGFLLLTRRPGNAVGLASFSIGLSWGLSFAGAWAIGRAGQTRAGAWIEMLVVPLGVLPWLAVVWLVLVFPTGDYAGRAERAISRATLFIGALAGLAFALSSKPQDLTQLPSPLAVPALDPLTGPIVSDAGFSMVIAVLVASVVLLVRRWRLSSGAERQQYRLMLLGALLFAIILSVGQLVPDGSAIGEVFAETATVVGGGAIPICIGIAVTRYRLYEIDHIISRTFGYTVLVVALGLVYAFGAIWIPTRLVGDEVPPAYVAGSTLAVAALFNPLRRFVLGWADRRFHRSRYDAEQVAAEFAVRLRDEVDIDVLTADLTVVVAATIRPSSLGVWVSDR